MRPVHLRWPLIALVGVGGAVGTGVREALVLLWPTDPRAFPVTVFVINVVGAFVLGVLLETLTRRGEDAGPRRILRLALGTGVLGGFTTYSSLATDAATRLPHSTGVAFAYAAASLLVGALASFVGIAVAATITPRRHEPENARLETDPDSSEVQA